jgi:hypothetical protein
MTFARKLNKYQSNATIHTCIYNMSNDIKQQATASIKTGQAHQSSDGWN